jgi:hypothetical protein
LARLQNEEVDLLSEELRAQLLETRDLGQLRGDIDVDEATRAIIVLTDGLSVERVLYRTRVSPERQLALLEALLMNFTTAPVREGLLE